MSDVISVRGRVTDITSKQTNFGTMYDLVVDGRKYGAGKRVTVAKGDFVEFIAVQKGNFLNVQGNVTKLEEPKDAARSPSPAVPTNVGAHSSGGGGSYDARQNAITFQSARKDALEFVRLLHDTGALPVSAAKTAAAKGNRMEAVQRLVDHFTELFYHDTQQLGERFFGEGVGQLQQGEDASADDNW